MQLKRRKPVLKRRLADRKPRRNKGATKARKKPHRTISQTSRRIKRTRLVRKKKKPAVLFVRLKKPGLSQPRRIQVPQIPLPQVSHYQPAEAAIQQTDDKLKILFFVHSFYPESYGGTEKFIFNLARAMSLNGHRIKVIAHRAGLPEDSPLVHGDAVYDEYDYEGVTVLAYRHKLMDPARTFDIGDPTLTSFAETVIAQEQPDIVHVGHPMRAMEFMQACRTRGTPYIITLTDFWFICPKVIMLQTNGDLCAGPDNGKACLTHCQIPNVEQRITTHLPILLSASKILSPSESLAARVKHVVPELNVEVLNHGMRYETILPNRKVYRRGSSLTLMYGGALGEHKGVHLIIEALSYIKSRRVRLKIYGDGPPLYMEMLKKAAAKDRRIELCGVYTEHDISRIYQDADVAIVPSLWYENYPLALHEALASHVPVLASNVGGMAEKVKNNVNGYTFQIGDPWHLAKRIKTLLNNPLLLNKFKSNMEGHQIPSIKQEEDSYENIYYSLTR